MRVCRASREKEANKPMAPLLRWVVVAVLPITVASFLSTLDPSHGAHVNEALLERSAGVSALRATSSSKEQQEEDELLATTIRRVRSDWDGINPSELPKYLVQRGMKRLQHEMMDNDSVDTMQNPQRVPGCIATVRLEPILRSWQHQPQEVNRDEDDQPPRLAVIVDRLLGMADAHVSRGLLDIVAELVQGLDLTRCDIRTITAADLQLDAALSPGRTNGLTSMLSTIYNFAMKTDHEKNALQSPMVIRSRTTNTVPTINNETKRPSVALLLSGGVDSSVALHLLLQQGYNVTTFYLKIWLEDELAHLSKCPWEDDVSYCEQVCQQANVRLETLSLQKAYHERVIQHTLQEARMGRTPNPDILCNSLIKFGVFWDQIGHSSFDYIATGHYAQIVRDHGVAKVRRAPDPIKDQSYFLCRLTQAQLQRVLFPIGHLEKVQVRQIADQLQLPNRHRPDSQGLCFLGKVKFDDFLSSYLPNSAGQVLDALTGETVGEHRGLHFHTVGQRRGMGKVLFPKSTSTGPWYVVAKDMARNILYCTNRYDDTAWDESRCDVTLENVHWQNPHWQFTPGWYDVKIRHGPSLARGHLSYFGTRSPTFRQDTNDDGSSNDSSAADADEDDTTLFLHLDAKDKGLAPGQSVVIYTDDGICLGGGIISERHWNVLLEHHHHQLQRRVTPGVRMVTNP
jgi:tRNA-5-taurinomethyluridine 2-sulfurtransferase